MKAKNSISFRSFARLPLTGLAVGIGLLACGPPFRLMSCPEGTTHNGKGGDVSDVCIPNDQLAGNAGAGGEGGTGAGQGGGSVGASGSGGMGGECEPTATKCVDGAEYTCGSGLTWGDSVACDIACDQAGSKCVVPVQLVGGAGHACALLSDQTVRCWGLGADGQLGNGRGPNGSGPNQLAPKEVANLAGVTKLVAGARSTCAHFADGSMSCWGDNSSKQLQAFDGNVYTPAAIELPAVDSESNPIVALGLGAFHTCALNGKGQIYCRGQNTLGQVGAGATGTDVEKFALVNSPQTVVFKQVFAGGATNFATDENGDLYCWGDNLNGVCDGQYSGGSPSTAHVVSPQKFRSTGAISEDVKSVQAVSVNALYSEFQTYANVCVTLTDGKPVCWGNNAFGQLGLGNGTADDTVTAYNSPRRPLVGESAVQRTLVGIGYACAVVAEKDLLCWGSNDLGQLGVPCGPALSCDASSPPFTTSYYGVPNRVPIGIVLDSHAGNSFACALTYGSKVYCWGDNSGGQLGVNKTYEELPSTATPTPVVWK